MNPIQALLNLITIPMAPFPKGQPDPKEELKQQLKGKTK